MATNMSRIVAGRLRESEAERGAEKRRGAGRRENGRENALEK